MADLRIRDFPDDLLKELKRFALDDDTTLQALVRQMATEYVERRKASERKAT